MKPAVKNAPLETLAVIQARMGSKRLPGKVLLDIEGRPMLGWVIDRARRSQFIDEVVVATSNEASDDPIASFCAKENIVCFRGSESDVLDRFYQTARAFAPENVVRLTADCPFIDPEVIDQILSTYKKTGVDYATNIERYTYPEGLDTEVFSFAALELAWKEADTPAEREHVTPYIRKSGKFSTKNVENRDDLSAHNHHWSVDSLEDLEFVRQVCRQLGGRSDFSFQDVLALLSERPKLRAVPKGYVLNSGYYRSLYDQAKAGAAPKLNQSSSLSLFRRASQSIPGCAQTFSKSSLQFVQGVSPVYLQRGHGHKVWDVDGNEYIDYIQGLLANILGYAHEEVNDAVIQQMQEGISFSLPHSLEITLAEKLKEIIPCAEMVRFGKNGSDVTAGAVRAARAFTGRDRVAACGYHGWQDWYIGSTTRNAGVPEGVQKLTHTFPYNDLEKLEALLLQYPQEFAAVIMEPLNFTEPLPGYLQGVRELTQKHGCLLIFDEICSGWVFGLGGAQKLFQVTPDLACFGKAMGNGFPISCVVGKSDVMQVFQEIFFSFTFGGEAGSLAAALKVIEILETTDALTQISQQGKILQDGFNSLAREAGLGNRFECTGRPQWGLLKFKNSEGKESLLERSLFQQETVKRGILLLATHNMCARHDALSTERTLQAYAAVFKTLKNWLGDEKPERFLEGPAIRPVFRVRS
jgi:glutamate-1-semialdehyde aminotransferase/spore coat polysaccharide biosynthesis protein SpsF (cytidylyltransferase family)